MPCKECGATELILIPASNESLERELYELFAQKVPWYRPFKRRWYRQLPDQIEEITGELRAGTLHA